MATQLGTELVGEIQETFETLIGRSKTAQRYLERF